MCRFNASIAKTKLVVATALCIYCGTNLVCFGGEVENHTPADSDVRSTAIDVGTSKQLFIDGRFIASSHGVKLVMHPPHQDGRVLIRPDQPWETGGRIAVYSSVIHEKERTRIWYDLLTPTGKGDYDHQRCVCYAESRDGLQFEKPLLGLHDFNGSKANNVVLPGVIGGCAVWVDPKADPAHRYKTQAKVYPSGQLHMHSSPDGLQWTKFARLDPGKGGWDTQSIVFWDPAIERYTLFTRYWNNNEDRARRYRTVRRLESQDLRTWTQQTIVMQPNATDLATYDTSTGQPPVDYYGADVFRYEGIYIMLAQAFWHWQSRPPEDGLGPSTFDVRLAISRDGKNFQRVGRWSPFLSLGPAGRFDSRFVWAMPDPVRMGDELWFYYVGNNRDHDGVLDPASKGQVLSGISRAVLRLDGFVSARASYDGGQLTTPLIRFKGSKLTLNIDAGGGGAVIVELLDEAGHAIPGYSKPDATPVSGNSVRAVVKWSSGSDLSNLAGRAIRLRLSMRDCDLYAFQFLE